MIRRTSSQKTRAAIGLLLNDAAARRDRSRAKRIGGTKHGDDRQADGSRNMHRARIVADEQVALREQCGQIGNRGFPREINWRTTHFSGDGGRDASFGGSSKEEDIGIRLGLQKIRHVGKPRGRPALRRAVRCSNPNGNSQCALVHAGFAQKIRGAPALLLWDAQTGAEIRRFHGHTGGVGCVAFLPDGRRAVSCSDDRTIRLWDIESGQEIHCFRGHTSELTWVAIAPDGRQAIVALPADGQGFVGLVDLDTWDVKMLPLGAEPTRVRLSPDGAMALVLSDRSKVAWVIR